MASPKAAPFTTRAPFTSTSTGGASGERWATRTRVVPPSLGLAPVTESPPQPTSTRGAATMAASAPFWNRIERMFNLLE